MLNELQRPTDIPFVPNVNFESHIGTMTIARARSWKQFFRRGELQHAIAIAFSISVIGSRRIGSL